MSRAGAVVAMVALTASAGSALGDDLAYERSARVRYVVSALVALRAVTDESLADTYNYIYAIERNRCRAPLESLRVGCLLEAARRNCSQREQAVRAQCHVVSDVIVSNRLSQNRFIDRNARLAIMNETSNYRRALERELRRRYAALVAEMTMTSLGTSRSPADDQLAAAIEQYCLAVAGTRDLSWQHCAAATVWFIGTTGREL